MEEDMTREAADTTLRKLIHNLNNNYVYWEKFKDMQLPSATSHEEVWSKAVAEREQGFFRQLSVGPLTIKWWLSNSMEALLHQLDIELAGGRGMEALLEQKHVHRHRTSALLEESITSAQLAGILVTKKAAKEMLLKKRSPQNVSEQVCVNIYRALQLALSQKNQPLNEPLFLALHKTLTKDTIKLKGIGRYRTNNKVDISSIDAAAKYKPVDAGEVASLMPGIFELYNNDTEPFFIHPLIKACLIHYLVITVRPFKDGNGRMARLLAQMYLLKKEYWVAEFISVSNIVSKFKQQYHKSITHSQNDANNIGYFIQFYVQSIQIAGKSLKDFVKRITKEKDENAGYKLPGYNERQTAVLQWIKEDGEKAVTIRELRSVYGISKETARTDLTALIEKGWLKFYHINKKTYAFVKGERFDELIQNNG